MIIQMHLFSGTDSASILSPVGHPAPNALEDGSEGAPTPNSLEDGSDGAPDAQDDDPLDEHEDGAGRYVCVECGSSYKHKEA